MRNTVGCFAVIEDEKHDILLVKRKDFPLWDLPGGRQAKGKHWKNVFCVKLRKKLDVM